MPVVNPLRPQEIYFKALSYRRIFPGSFCARGRGGGKLKTEGLPLLVKFLKFRIIPTLPFPHMPPGRYEQPFRFIPETMRRPSDWWLPEIRLQCIPCPAITRAGGLRCPECFSFPSSSPYSPNRPWSPLRSRAFRRHCGSSTPPTARGRSSPAVEPTRSLAVLPGGRRRSTGHGRTAPRSCFWNRGISSSSSGGNRIRRKRRTRPAQGPQRPCAPTGRWGTTPCFPAAPTSPRASPS